MDNSPFITDVTPDQFQSRVIETSHRLPVLVDFWAPWCGPCRVLMPLLARLAAEYGGKFFLAKVNTDGAPELAATYGIRGIPAVKLFRNGNVVDEFVGVQPEPAIRAILDRHIPRESDETIDRALSLAVAGQRTEAIALLREAAAREPTYDRAKIELVRLLTTPMEDEDARMHLSEARRTLDSLSIRAGADPEVEALRARLTLLEAAADPRSTEDLERTITAQPDDHEARYRLAARLALTNRAEAALEHFLDLVRRDRHFGDDAGRKGLVATFQLLGSRDTLVTKYRGLLARALH